MNSRSYCHCCGAPRGISTPQESYSLHDILVIGEHREIQRHPGQMFEMSPQLIVHVGVYRNGGGTARNSEHICNDCLLVGIRHALAKLQKIASDSIADKPAEKGDAA